MKKLSHVKKLGHWMGGWMDGKKDGRAGYRLAYSIQQISKKIKTVKINSLWMVGCGYPTLKPCNNDALNWQIFQSQWGPEFGEKKVDAIYVNVCIICCVIKH